MILIGLTGGIATGKSTCSEFLAKTSGVTVVDCDKIVHDLQRPGSEANRAIKKAFPTCVSDDGTYTLDRKALGDIIFADPSRRRALGAIMNKRIFFAVMARLAQCWASLPSRHVVVLDAPTLFESGSFVRLVSAVVVVAAPEDAQLARLMARNGFTRTEALARMGSQMPLAEKRRRADFVIENDEEGVDGLEAKVAAAVEWARRTQGPGHASRIAAGVIAVAATAGAVAVAVPLLAVRALVAY